MTRSASGVISVRQPPGPRNALGRVKIEMPNQWAIYLHDTPSQALFGRPARAFSHGCIRTQNVRDFAALLLAPTGRWDRGRHRPRGRYRAQPARRRSPTRCRSISPISPRPRPATAISSRYNDVYGRDAPVRAALNHGGAAPPAAGQRRQLTAERAERPPRHRLFRLSNSAGSFAMARHLSYWNATAPASAFPTPRRRDRGRRRHRRRRHRRRNRGAHPQGSRAQGRPGRGAAGRRGGHRQVDREDHLAAQYRLPDHRAEVRRGGRPALCRGQ